MTTVYGLDNYVTIHPDISSGWVRQVQLTSSRALVCYPSDSGSPDFDDQVVAALVDTSGTTPSVVSTARIDLAASNPESARLARVGDNLAVLSVASVPAWVTIERSGDALTLTEHADTSLVSSSSFNLSSPMSVRDGRLCRLVRRRPTSQYVYAVQVWEFSPSPSLLDELILTTSGSAGLWNPRTVLWDSDDGFLVFTDDNYPDLEVVKFTVSGGAIVTDGTDVLDSTGDYYWLGNIFPPISPTLLPDGRVLWGVLKISTNGGTEMFYYDRTSGASSTGVVLGVADGTYTSPFDYYHAATLTTDGTVLIYSHAPDMTSSFVLWRDGVIYAETVLPGALTEPSFILGSEFAVTTVRPGKWLLTRTSPATYPGEQDSRIIYLGIPPLRQNQRDDPRQNQRTSQQLTVRQRGYL